MGCSSSRLQQHQRQPQRKNHRGDDHTHESHRAEGLLLNVGHAEEEADAVVHAQEEAERRTRWTLFAEACAARTYCIGPAGRMRW